MNIKAHITTVIILDRFSSVVHGCMYEQKKTKEEEISVFALVSMHLLSSLVIMSIVVFVVLGTV